MQASMSCICLPAESPTLHTCTHTHALTHRRLPSSSLLPLPLWASAGRVRTIPLHADCLQQWRVFLPHFFSLVDTVWGARMGEKGGKKRVLFKLVTAVAAKGNYWKEYIKQHRSIYPPHNPLFQHQSAHPSWADRAPDHSSAGWVREDN